MIQFAARVEKDGSLRVPQSALDDLGLHPGDTVQVSLDADPEASMKHMSNEDAAEQTRLDQALRAMTRRTLEEITVAQQCAMTTYLPKRTVPPGKTLADEVSGKWPGEETDAQIEAALEELS